MPVDQALIHRLLQSTLTKNRGEKGEQLLSSLGQYIAQQLGSPPSQGECTKLAQTYTEQTRDGTGIRHEPPNGLWEHSQVFREWAEERIAYYKSQKNITPVMRRKRCVSLICAYHHTSGMAWLDYLDKKGKEGSNESDSYAEQLLKRAGK
jgi:hypothetical protein